MMMESILYSILLFFLYMPSGCFFVLAHVPSDSKQIYWVIPRGGTNDKETASASASTTTYVKTTKEEINKSNHTIQPVHSAVGLLVLSSDSSEEGSMRLAPWGVSSSPFSQENDNNGFITGFSCILFDKNYNAVGKVLDLPQDQVMIKNLVFLCDIVVVVLPNNDINDKDALNEDFVCALIQGANQRMELLASSSSSLPSSPSSSFQQARKPRLIVVIPQDAETSKDEEDSILVNDIVQRQLASIVPSTWESFDVISQSRLEMHIKELLNEQEIIFGDGRGGMVHDIFLDEDEGVQNNGMVVMQLFVRLLHQIYQVESQSPNDVKVEPFELQLIQTSSVTSPTSATNENAHDDSVTMNETNHAETITTKPKTRRIHHHDINDKNDNKDDSSQIQKILATCQQKLETLESKLQDVLLLGSGSGGGVDDGTGANDDQPSLLPLLDFGSLADDVLNSAYTALASSPPGFRLGLLTPVVKELHRLYRDQLQTLRDYYGKRYERILFKDDSDNDKNKNNNNQEEEWTRAAEYTMQGFQAAAANSIPSLCKPNQPLAGIISFDPTSSLQGLITDMMEATQRRKDEHSLALEDLDSDDDDDDDDDGDPGNHVMKRLFDRVPKWFKKFAGRALVLGVNYIQGWLAWQGVKRAAMERDRSMPKFPLF